MVDFDSWKPSVKYEEVYNLTEPSFLQAEIDLKYSKELRFLTEEVSKYKENWDSYNSLPPIQSSLSGSVNFLSNFTRELKKTTTSLNHFPEFCLAPDGVLGFEWDYNKDSNLFARIHSQNEVEFTLKENNKQHRPRTEKIEKFIEICNQKIHDINQVA